MGEKLSEYLHLMKLAMGRHPAVNAVVRVESLVKACNYFYSRDEAISAISGGSKLADGSANPSNAIYISDLEDDTEFLSLLFVRGNPNKRLPSFVNMRDRIVKPLVPEDDGDVPGASCHVVISKSEIASGHDQGRYRMAIERTTGLSKTLVRDFLTDLMARYAEAFPGEFVAPKRRKKKGDKLEEIAFRPTCKFNPQQNGSLKSDLENGMIGGFKLVRGIPSFRGEASSPMLQRVNVKLEAKIAPTEDFAEVHRLVNLAKEALAGVDFEGMNLELVDASGDIHRTQTLPVDQLMEDDMRYCKTIAIDGLTGTGSECYAELQAPYVKAAKKAINTPSHWTTK